MSSAKLQSKLRYFSSFRSATGDQKSNVGTRKFIYQ